MSADIFMLVEHNAWANDRLVVLAERLADEEAFGRVFPMGEGSLHGTLVHIAGAMLHWADRLSDRAVGEAVENQRFAIGELGGLFDSAHRSLSLAVHEIIKADRLEEMMTHPASPEPFTRRTAIHHVLTHSGHHRAQAINMFRHTLNTTDLPDTDVIEYVVFGENDKG